jgi:hypothetical protein
MWTWVERDEVRYRYVGMSGFQRIENERLIEGAVN